jgi:AraC-like DNA-binding protein
MVDVIAERVGYADPSHFIRMFRREHGATPAAWRAAHARPAAHAPSLAGAGEAAITRASRRRPARR